MVVDCHVNIWNDEHVQPHYYTQLGRVRERTIESKADADSLHEAMASVDRAIIFALRYGDTIGVESDDEMTAAAVAKYWRRFVGFAYVDPRRPDYMDLLRHAIEDLGLKGVKYGPIYNGVPLDDPRMDPVYQYCVDHNLPLTMHMGTTYTRKFGAELGRPIHVEGVALRYPDLKLVMAHMGHPWYEECVIVARKQPNVYAEISALLSALAVLQCYDVHPGISGRGQDLLRKRLSVFTSGRSDANDARCSDITKGSNLPRFRANSLNRSSTPIPSPIGGTADLSLRHKPLEGRRREK